MAYHICAWYMEVELMAEVEVEVAYMDKLNVKL